MPELFRLVKYYDLPQIDHELLQRPSIIHDAGVWSTVTTMATIALAARLPPLAPTLVRHAR